MMKDVLAGFRCTDFTWVFAGPYAGQLLGDLGMEMIKIESRKRMDVVRNYPPFAHEDRRINSSGYWNTHNRSKYSINLDMKSEKAREIVTQLIAMSDLVLENFSARGMKAIGFDYERLREINPRIVYCSMAGFGHRGPYKNYVAYGPMQESQAGIVHLTGWPDDSPSRVGTSYPDAAAGVSAAFAIVGALRHARRTGRGQWIDLGQTLTSAALTDTAVIEYTVNGDIQQRNGDLNRFFARTTSTHAAAKTSGVPSPSTTMPISRSWQQLSSSPNWHRMLVSPPMLLACKIARNWMTSSANGRSDWDITT
jgi:crotonobetainyl-CoA:carnitine CoA-transferase CaiB-like acyl-CoA transferase